jgi:enamine deaminase RidA (YjgF/YER057c/UK114 family)
MLDAHGSERYRLAMTSAFDRRLQSHGIQLPDVAAPVATYRPAVRHGDLVLTSGQIPFVNGELAAIGRVGAEIDVEEARALAKTCALNGLAAVAAVLADTEDVLRVLRVGVFVASAPGFREQAKVAEGASALLAGLFPDGHARTAVGVSELPLGAPVEVELIALAG